MNRYNKYPILIIACSSLFFNSCKTPALIKAPEVKEVPASYAGNTDTLNSGMIQWRTFFSDKYLQALIDTALKNNQELAITLQDIEMARNDIRVRQGLLLPRAEAGFSTGVEKVGRYTSQGAGDASTEITPGKEVPEWLTNIRPAVFASWEADIWHKLRNSKKAAVNHYLSTVEGRNFVITNLIAEIANAYYELLCLDNKLDIVRQTISLQENALSIVKVQKQAAAANELAVKKFQAEVLGSKSLEYDLLQKRKAKENEINFLLGRYPQKIERDTTGILQLNPAQITTGIPSQLLVNRPDIKQAELELAAARLDVKVARAEFYPSLNITAALGLEAFNPKYLVKMPESLLFTLAGDVTGPLINKRAIKAEYFNANARQIQAVYDYERKVLNAFVEVSTELSNIENLQRQFSLKAKQVDTLTAAVDIAADLFRSARADYLEVLMTQRDMLATKLELAETKLYQFNSVTNIYRALGGGWK
jgi:NodT family efflux transporter outer membrane factor (OMF) lipoprotein